MYGITEAALGVSHLAARSFVALLGAVLAVELERGLRRTGNCIRTALLVVYWEPVPLE